MSRCISDTKLLGVALVSEIINAVTLIGPARHVSGQVPSLELAASQAQPTAIPLPTGPTQTQRLSSRSDMATYFFSSPVDVDVKLEGEELRKQVESKAEKDRPVSCPVYYDGESVSGQVRRSFVFSFLVYTVFGLSFCWFSSADGKW